MRIVKEIPHPRFKITVYSWNNKYIIKVEDAHLEQVYKIEEAQVEGIADVERIINTPFLLTCLERFGAMSRDFNEAWRHRHTAVTPPETHTPS